MTECLFNNAVPLIVKPFNSFIGAGSSFGATATTMASSMPFYSTSAPLHLQPEARRLDSVIFEIYLIPIVANKKVLQVRISDVNDPFFRWQVDLTEEEFYVLRGEQNLLIDFASFPYKLIELLQRCLQAASNSEQPITFSAQLTIPAAGSPISAAAGNFSQTAQLSFVEMTSFRQVTQLSLKLHPVDSEQVRRQLSDLLRQYREQISALQSQLNAGMPSGMASSDAAKFQKPSKTHSTPLGISSLVKEKDEACAHLNQLYEVTREAKNKVEDDNEELKREFEIIRNRFEDSQGEVMKANEIISKLQDELRTLKLKLKSASAIADDQMNAAEQLRASNKRLQSEYTEAAETAHTAKISAEALERDNKALRSKIEQLERNTQYQDNIIKHHQQQSNVRDLNRALRSLEIDMNAAGNDTATTTGNAAAVPVSEVNTTDFSFDPAPGGPAGYVGSTIFDQSF